MEAANLHEITQHIAFPDVPPLRGKEVSLLLGTDRHIDEGSCNQEKRVGFTPEQAKMLRDWLESVGISLILYVVRDAGVDAHYGNDAYAEAGATIIEEEELSSLSPLDVVHALKEPCQYESMITGPFVRIGALHVGAFHADSGLASLLRKRNFAAIFDGSAVGGFTCKISGGFQAPLRCSMSVFASRVAADTVSEHLKPMSKVVISGGGVVGVSALYRLLETGNDRFSEILIIESDRQRRQHLGRLFRDRPIVRIKHADSVSAEDLDGADGLILAAFRPGSNAPKVVATHALQHLNTGSVIIDVSIDEGGCIATLDGKTVEESIRELGRGLVYIADSHMPRRYPTEASEAHGKAVLPYLATLLYVCAQTGGPLQATHHILTTSRKKIPASQFDAFVLDLKSGLAFSGPTPICLNSTVVKSKDAIAKFLDAEGLQFLVH